MMKTVQPQVRLDSQPTKDHPNPNRFLFDLNEFEEVLGKLCSEQPHWPAALHLRQRYIHELTRRDLPVPKWFLVTPQDCWTKSFIAGRTHDGTPGVRCDPTEPLFIASENYGLISGMIANILNARKGTVFCDACQTTYPAKKLRVAKWGGGGPPLADAGGRTFSCPTGHCVLQVLDWIS